MKALVSGFAACLLVAGGTALAPFRAPAAPLPAAAPSVIDTVVLLRWGHGALDWLLPDPPRGDEHAPDRQHRH
jgi:hypothetical protein